MSLSIKIAQDTATPLLQRIVARLKEVWTGELEAVGRAMVEYAQGICPVRTGYLRSTIYFHTVSPLSFEFGASASYAVFVEMGTYRMAPRPFIRPALDAHREALAETGWKAVREAVR